MSELPAERLATIFVEVADTLADEFDLSGFLHLVATRAADLVGAVAAGVLLADEHDRLELLAASDENPQLLDLLRRQGRGGPGIEAFRAGRPVVDCALRPYPVQAFPLRLRAQIIGVLAIVGDPALFPADDAPILQALADVTTISLLQERTIRRGAALAEQLSEALRSRIVIEQAKGAIAERCGVSVDEAFQRIRAQARRTNQRLVDVAQQVLPP